MLSMKGAWVQSLVGQLSSGQENIFFLKKNKVILVGVQIERRVVEKASGLLVRTF